MYVSDTTKKLFEISFIVGFYFETRCISRNTEVHNISLMKSNTSSDLDTRVHDSCFEMTSENRTNMKRALCKTWKFTYSYGYAKTWVNEVSYINIFFSISVQV